jgi:hypothetical protein
MNEQGVSWHGGLHRSPPCTAAPRALLRTRVRSQFRVVAAAVSLPIPLHLFAPRIIAMPADAYPPAAA